MKILLFRYKTAIFVGIFSLFCVKGRSEMVYAFPNTEGSVVQFKEKYDNYIGGEWTPQ